MRPMPDARSAAPIAAPPKMNDATPRIARIAPVMISPTSGSLSGSGTFGPLPDPLSPGTFGSTHDGAVPHDVGGAPCGFAGQPTTSPLVWNHNFIQVIT